MTSRDKLGFPWLHHSSPCVNSEQRRSGLKIARTGSCNFPKGTPNFRQNSDIIRETAANFGQRKLSVLKPRNFNSGLKLFPKQEFFCPKFCILVETFRTFFIAHNSGGGGAIAAGPLRSLPGHYATDSQLRQNVWSIAHWLVRGPRTRAQ